MADLAILLYYAHALAQCLLGAKKLRGTYSGVVVAPEAAKFARHHGVSLLALALLGALCVRRGFVHTPTGTMCSQVLCVFHLGAALVMLYDANFLPVLLHAPFALAFAWHALTPPRGSRKR